MILAKLLVGVSNEIPEFQKNLTISRLVASINSGLPYINLNHTKVFMAGKVVSQEQLRVPLRALEPLRVQKQNTLKTCQYKGAP